MKTDMSALYATALILNPGCCTRYIEVNWPKKWVKPTLERVKKLWQSYQEAASLPTTLASPSYHRPFQEPKELILLIKSPGLSSKLLGQQAKMSLKTKILKSHMSLVQEHQNLHGVAMFNKDSVGFGSHVWLLISSQFQ